jgi:sporulation integral membrane protein YtvI
MNFIVQRYYKVILKVLFIAGFLMAVYISFTYLIPFFAPFVIGIILASINEPVIGFLQKKAKMPRKLASLVALLLTISVLGVLVTLGIIKIYNELLVLKNNVSHYINNTSAQFNEYVTNLKAYYNNLPEGITKAVSDNINSLTPRVQGIITSLVTYLIDTLSSIPKVTVFIIVCVLSAYFISSDRRKIGEFLYRQVPHSWAKNISGIKTGTFSALFGYFKALLILMLITFIEVAVGLSVIRAKYALLMGFIVGLSDAVPILGTSVVMIPWILWNVIIGDMNMALSLTVIYIAGVIMRQLLEPKIIGHQIGLHPLVTLTAMYIGMHIFGVLGVFIGPISLIILKNLQSSGIIEIWKE